eukprot:5065259-Amphidinium_carterae.1
MADQNPPKAAAKAAAGSEAAAPTGKAAAPAPKNPGSKPVKEKGCSRHFCRATRGSRRTALGIYGSGSELHKRSCSP